MKTIKYIGFIILLILLVNSITAQTVENYALCSNDSVLYTISGSQGSTFEWNIEGGEIVYSSLVMDTVILCWKVEEGYYQLQVKEITKDGCWAVAASDLRVADLIKEREEATQLNSCE